MQTDRRTRRLTAEHKTTSTGEPVWCDIIEDLTWGELKRFPPVAGTSWDDAGAAINRYVVAWNVEGRNPETGALEPLPVPADADDPALVWECVEPWIISWLFLTLRMVHLGADPKGSASGQTSSAPTPATESASPST
jgi:hypothetical protein